MDHLRGALKTSEAQASKLPIVIQKAMIEGIRSQMADLEQELAEYDRLKNTLAPIIMHSFADLPQVLIQARIMRGYTQKEFAKLLDMKEQQVQRYEAQEYSGVKLERLVHMGEALGVKLDAKVILK